METKSETLTLNERLLAALAHGSVLLSFFGPFLPGLVWTQQRRKSRFVAFQSLQALGYQALVLWVGLTIALVGLLVFLFSAVIPSMNPGMKLDSLPFQPLMERAILAQNLLYGVWGILCLPGIVGAGFTLAGREFYYPLLGKRLESWLAADVHDSWFNEAREDDWVAGVCHSSAVVLFWGMILPWLVWTSQKGRSERLRFQSLQAFLFQLLMLLSYAVAFALLFAMMVFVIVLAQYMNSPAGISSDAGIYLLVAVFVMLLFMCVMLLALPTYHLLALVAWVRVVRGREYLYPLIGRMMGRRMKDGT